MAKPGRKTLLTPELQERMVQVMRETGMDKAAFEAVKISHESFYKYLRENAGFASAIASAKSEFLAACPDEVVKLAKQTVTDYLLNGAREVWKTTEIRRDAAGNIIETKEIIREIQRGTPAWCVERILGRTPDVLDAVLTLLSNGMMSTDQARVVSEGIALIKAQLKQASSQSADAQENGDRV